jgi:hypothetical protein
MSRTAHEWAELKAAAARAGELYDRLEQRDFAQVSKRVTEVTPYELPYRGNLEYDELHDHVRLVAGLLTAEEKSHFSAIRVYADSGVVIEKMRPKPKLRDELGSLALGLIE